MRIYTRSVSVWDEAQQRYVTDEAESEWFEYAGPVAECKKGGKKPKTPDPVAVSQAQTQSNQDTAAYNAALNRTNTYTPAGSSEFTVTGTDPSGAPIYRQDVKLAPQAQALYDQQLGQNIKLGNIADSMMNGMADFYGRPMDTSGVPALRGSYQVNPYQTSIDTSGLPALQGGIDMSGAPALRGSAGQATQIGGAATANGVSSAGLPKLWGAEDLQGERQQVQDALYNRAAAYLDPQWNQRDTAFRTRMANQGVVEGSEAWRNALDDESRARTFEYGDARDRAIIGGMNEMQGLSGIARGNRSDLFGERATSAGIQNQAAGINNAFSLGNANRLDSFNLANAGFQNDARSQALAEALASGSFANNARSQGFNERVAGADFANNAIGAGNRDAAAAAAFGNNARAQGMDELYAARAQPLNEFNAFRSASPVDMPQFAGASPVNMANTDVAGNYWNAFDANMAKYNAAQQQQNGMMSGLFGLGSSALTGAGAAGGFGALFSDERLKENIEPLGELPDGTPTYEYNYKGDDARHAGVMAQEAERAHPGAIKTHPSGFKMVDYARLLAEAMKGGRHAYA